MSTSDDLVERVARGEVYVNPYAQDVPPDEIYEPEAPICALTLDRRQAWVLLVLLSAWREPPGKKDWEFVRAAYDVRRRIAEAIGTK